MNIARLSIKRPIFICCIVALIVIMGFIGLKRIGVDIYPPVDFPVITVTTYYTGASPEDIEKLISKPLEEQISTISGLKTLSSQNMEGISIVIAEFTYETEIKYAEQKMREKVDLARNNLPDDLEDDPLVKQFDITDTPVLTLAISASLSATELYDLAKERIKPMIEQSDGVGEVRISGGTRREIQVELDRNKLNAYEIPARTIADQLKNAGANVPVGKFDRDTTSTLFRAIGEYTNLEQIRKSIVSFSGDVNKSITIANLGTVRDGAEEATTITSIYSSVSDINQKPGFFKRIFSNSKQEARKMETRPCIILDVFKQSGSNPVSVVDKINARMPAINDIIKNTEGKPRLFYVFDSAKYIRNNIDDVVETMIIGIILAIIVVYFFLGNIRSTIITGIAIPNSLLGAFLLMYVMGFTVNIMTLMALSLTVGLLVDDAIVVRENIFRKLEAKMHPMKAAELGTTEVMLPVIATTLTIIAVFLPIGFLSGIIGRFFKQFGLTVVFAMAISLFDALAVAPLLSAYFAGKGGKAKNRAVMAFDRFQDRLDVYYEKIVSYSIDHVFVVIGITCVVFFCSIWAFGAVKKTFMPDSDQPEVLVNIELPSKTSLTGTYEVANKIADRIKTIPDLNYMTIQAGNANNESNIGSIGVFMFPRNQRKKDMDGLKKDIRQILAEFQYAKPSITNYSRTSMGSSKPYTLNLNGENLDELNVYSENLIEKLKSIKDLTEISSSYIAGKPEFQIVLDENKMQMLGVANKTAGTELRYHIAGTVAGKLREKGLEYDVRLRLKPDQRDLSRTYMETRVPNIQNRMIPLTALAKGELKTGQSKIIRQDRSRAVQIYANISQGGAMGTAIGRTEEILTKEMPLPKGVTYSFKGQADAFKDMIINIITAFVLSIIFIYLVLSSLYESFFTPATILMALPPALSGAFFALLLTGKNMDMFGMIGIIMLLGLVTKNSILLVDFALEGVRSGLSRKEAIKRAGKIRLRPILMTTFAMLAGTLPMALGVGEAAKFRTGMGVVILGGLIISTGITLIVVPAIFEYVDKFREFIESKFRPKQMDKLEETSCEEIMMQEFKKLKKSTSTKKKS
ncbi:MAG: efflux RND transporter permease subunit [Spirochaetota bacterium]